jgi:hypothetical protein
MKEKIVNLKLKEKTGKKGKNKLKLYLLIFLLFSSCSTPGNNEPQITPKGAKDPVTIGKISQSLSLIKILRIKGDMVDRAGMTIVSHLISTFYGQITLNEEKINEEKFILSFCKKNGFPSKNAIDSSNFIIKNILKNSKIILNQYKKIPLYEKQVKILQNEIFYLIDEFEKNLFSSPLVYFKKRRVLLKLSSDAKTYTRLPPGVYLSISKGVVESGDFYKNEISNFDTIESIFQRGANFPSDSKVSIIIPMDEPLKPVIKLLNFAKTKGVSSIIIWGRKDKISYGFEVNLYNSLNVPKLLNIENVWIYLKDGIKEKTDLNKNKTLGKLALNPKNFKTWGKLIENLAYLTKFTRKPSLDVSLDEFIQRKDLLFEKINSIPPL